MFNLVPLEVDGRYGMSPTGDIFKFEGMVKLTKTKRKDGYLSVWLGGRKGKSYLHHRLVAITLLGEPPEGKLEVNHKDGDRSNNHPDNLEWVSEKENLLHARRVLKSSILTDILVHDVQEGTTALYGSIRECSKAIGQKESTIRMAYKEGWGLFKRWYFKSLYDETPWHTVVKGERESYESLYTQNETFIVRDYLHDKIFTVVGKSKLPSELGLYADAVTRYFEENQNGLLGHYDVIPEKDFTEWPSRSHSDYLLSGNKVPVLVTSIAGEKSVYASIKLALSALLPDVKCYRQAYRQLKAGRPYKGFLFERLKSFDDIVFAELPIGTKILPVVSGDD